MPVPFVDLKSAIAETEPLWRENLAELHARSSYILGRQVEAFETEFARAMGAAYAVGVGSGCGAIEVCLRAAGVTRESQQVLTSALTAPFTAVAIQAAGATPVFADIDPETLLVDPDDAGNRLTRRVAAIVPVHLYGQVCRIEEIARLAKAAKVPVIQDACQAHGAADFTKFSPYVTYSFYPTKNLGALGDGGAIVTSSARVAKNVREIRDGGRRGGHVSYVRGINSRLDEMQACYLRAFLTRLPVWNARRVELARRYDERLRDVPGVRLVARPRPSVCHLYVVRAARRDKLRAFLASRGVPTGVHYPAPLHLQPAFRGRHKKGDLPVAEKASREIVSLPLHPFLSESQVDEVAESVKKFYD
jgi:dTDP-3-amino-3,4,6-trideoxy-alpha-D-glucose transaminase